MTVAPRSLSLHVVNVTERAGAAVSRAKNMSAPSVHVTVGLQRHMPGLAACN